MPEGHTIHRLAKLHNRMLKGRVLQISSPQGRFTADARQVDGRRLNQITPHGKHLLYGFDNGLWIHVHLGMHGAFRTLPMPARGEALPEPRGKVRMRIIGGTKIVELTGPTACEVYDEQDVGRLRDRLGPDVLHPRPNSARVWSRIHKSKAPIGGLLMDQSVVSGIGNAYRAELLYRQKLHPLLPGSALTRQQFDALWHDAVQLLKLGVKLGHIITVDVADIGKPLRKATRDDRFLIYNRPTCRRCGSAIQQFTLAGRVCYFCPDEQILPPRARATLVTSHTVAVSKTAARKRNPGDAEK